MSSNLYDVWAPGDHGWDDDRPEDNLDHGNQLHEDIAGHKPHS